MKCSCNFSALHQQQHESERKLGRNAVWVKMRRRNLFVKTVNRFARTLCSVYSKESAFTREDNGDYQLSFLNRSIKDFIKASSHSI